MEHSSVYLTAASARGREMGGRASGRPWLAALLALGLTAMAPATGAKGATVSVFEGPLFKTPNARYASGRVEARPAEANRLSITLVGESGSYVLQVRDDAEPIEAGSGCEGGGVAGALVSCPLTVFPGNVTVVLGNQ